MFSVAEVVGSNENDPDSTPGNGILAEDDQEEVAVVPVQIGAAKRVSAGPTSNGDGSFNLTYTLLIENSGGATLDNIQMSDDLATTFSGAAFSIVSLTSADFLVNHHVGIETGFDVRTVHSMHRYGRAGWRGGSVGHTVVTEYERGTLLVDILHAPERRLVWRGTASARLRQN